MSVTASMPQSLSRESRAAIRTGGRRETLPPGELSTEEFFRILFGHTAFQLLWAGAELDLFSLLSKRPGLTRQQIGEALVLEPQPTRILLHGLTALRLLQKQGACYRNSPLAEKRLVRGAPQSLLPILGWQHHIVYRGQTDLVASLRANRNIGLRHFPGKGKTLYQRLQGQPALEKVFHDSMSCISSQANREFAAAIPLRNIRHLVDLGGGDGSNAILLARRFKTLKITVFDSETVAGIARRKIEAAGLGARIRAAGGDFLKDPLPAGADALLLAHIVPIWSAERNTRLFRRCFEHLPAGGRLFVFSMMSWDDETGPLINALGSPYFQAVATGEGMLYTEGDIRSWLQAAGFETVQSQALPVEHRLLTAIKA